MQYNVPRRTTMAAFHSVMMFVLLSIITLHLALLCGVIPVGTEFQGSMAVTLHESEDRDDDSDGDGRVTLQEPEQQEELEVFEPTNEWQTIKEGQAIPAGLHIRINLATGVKEAKILDNEGTTQHANQIGETDGSLLPTGDEPKREVHENQLHGKTTDSGEELLTKAELQRRLANLEECEEEDTDRETMIEEVKKRYRSMEQLKKEFAELDLNIETDFEIMTRLVKEYQEYSSVERRKLILQDLEFYVHQIDNAVDLARIGGWDIIIEALNDTQEVIHSEAAHVLGSAVQSNPKAQVLAMDRGAMQLLLRHLSRSASVPVQKRALFGLSSLIRFFPFAQQKFLQLGGLSVLSGLMRETKISKFPLKVKSLTLLHDLVIEQRDILDSAQSTDDDVSRQRRLQYEQVNIESQMLDQGWCEFVPALLDVPDHDTREKVLLAIQTLSGLCGQYYSTSLIKDRLESLRMEYDTLAAEENADDESDGYFAGLATLVNKISKQLKS